MANQEHLALLKKGVEKWNKWRKDHPNTWLDLNEANLSNVNLSGADLNRINLIHANLNGTTLKWSNLYGADLSRAMLYRTNLYGSILSRADLSGADLSGADLSEAKLSNTNLSDADLRRTSLTHTDLSGTNLCGVDLSWTEIGWTNFGNVDLRLVKGLETITHHGPSTIGIDTIYRSQGNIPDVFLKGAGVNDTFITYIRSLVGKAIDYYTSFISYSSKDHDFAERLYTDLQSKGVRCWFAPEDMKIGDKIRPRIDEAIRIHDKLLLVLSEHSVESAWVEKEVETAFEKERLQNRLVLFPIRLDDAVMITTQAWAADIRRTRHIGDFRNWKSHDEYQKAFSRLLRDLKAES